MPEWPRQYYQWLRGLPESERPTALQSIPAHFRPWVALYLSMPEDHFAEMKTAARIARLPGKDRRTAALAAIADPERRRRIRTTARDLFYRGRA